MWSLGTADLGEQRAGVSDDVVTNANLADTAVGTANDVAVALRIGSKPISSLHAAYRWRPRSAGRWLAPSLSVR